MQQFIPIGRYSALRGKSSHNLTISDRTDRPEKLNFLATPEGIHTTGPIQKEKLWSISTNIP